MLANSATRSLVNIRFKGQGVDKTVTGAVGENLLHIAEENGIHLPNACEGSGACGTCQLYITKGMDKLSEITDKENDTLDFAIEVHDESRLACQAIVQADSGEVEALIPKQNRNII